ncbi:hypothetical protein AB0B10_25690 [Micromonospora arborensis]|uniref:hypothetical protein n=1 Tax=Micromonospora arborensis TaxID=2116518 RepID=UPI0033D1FE9D
MSYGHWIRGAEASIVAARQSLRAGRAADDRSIADTAVARSRVYQGLAALTEVLANLPATGGMTRRDADQVLGKVPATPAVVRGGLLAAAAAERVVATRQPVAAPGRAFVNAARKLSTAREILLSHAPPRRAPLTPEGVAIRAGAGQEAALGDVGRLLDEMVLADAAVAGWLSGSETLPAARPLAEVALWASTSDLAVVAQELMAVGNRSLALLHGLNPPPLPHMTESTAIRSADDAAEKFAGVCSWLYRNPGQARTAHLATGTRLGLAICLAAGARDARLPWNDAAIMASNMAGSPPDEEGQLVADQMQQLSRWIQDDVRKYGPPTPGPRQEALDRLALMLPILAERLLRVMRVAVPRGEVFLRERAGLHKAPGQKIFHAVGAWRVANPWSAQITAVRQTLTAAAATAPAQRTVTRVASRGFLPLAVAARLRPDAASTPAPAQRRQARARR